MRTGIAFVISAIAAGCSAFTGISSAYPKGWPEIVSEPAGCPNINGRYESQGGYSFLPEENENSLVHRFGGEYGRSVRIELSSDQLTVDMETIEGALFQKVLSGADGDFACGHGVLVLKPILQSGGDGTGGYRSERRLVLHRANNGDLIGEDRLFSVGAFLWVVPISGSQVFWYRWRAQTNES